jgi:hypothetical protein
MPVERTDLRNVPIFRLVDGRLRGVKAIKGAYNVLCGRGLGLGSCCAMSRGIRTLIGDQGHKGSVRQIHEPDSISSG